MQNIEWGKSDHLVKDRFTIELKNNNVSINHKQNFLSGVFFGLVFCFFGVVLLYCSFLDNADEDAIWLLAFGAIKTFVGLWFVKMAITSRFSNTLSINKQEIVFKDQKPIKNKDILFLQVIISPLSVNRSSDTQSSKYVHSELNIVMKSGVRYPLLCHSKQKDVLSSSHALGKFTKKPLIVKDNRNSLKEQAIEYMSTLKSLLSNLDEKELMEQCKHFTK